MTEQHGTDAAAIQPSAFDEAYANFHARLRAWEAVKDLPRDERPSGPALNELDDAFKAMMSIPAPTMFALHEKIVATTGDIAENCGWETQYYADRLAADAGILALQFAKVWLERWTDHHGASAQIDDCRGNKLSLFIPEFSWSAHAPKLEAVQDAGGVTDEEQRGRQRGWHASFYDGAIRELAEMLDLVPGARAAVTAIVAENPEAGLPQSLRGEG